MNPITAYNKILKYRNILKSLQQISWETAQLDRRFPLDSLKDNEFPKLLNSYEELVSRGLRVLENLNGSKSKQA